MRLQKEIDYRYSIFVSKITNSPERIVWRRYYHHFKKKCILIKKLEKKNLLDEFGPD